MKLIKLTLLLCFFTIVLFGQQEAPGYIVSLEGDTLEGRIVIGIKWVKLKHEGVKTKYYKTDISDYGYYGNRVYFSKPDVTPPVRKSKIVSTLVFADGVQVSNFYLHKFSLDNIIGYFEYPKYVSYEAKKKDLTKFIIHDETEGDIHMYLIPIDDYPEKGETLYVYAEGIISDGLVAYNVNRSKPYRTVYKTNGVLATLLSNTTPLGIIGPSAIAKVANRFVQYGRRNNWLIYKNDTVYEINTWLEWKQSYDEIFNNDKEFSKYLKEREIDYTKIEQVLKAYADYMESK